MSSKELPNLGCPIWMDYSLPSCKGRTLALSYVKVFFFVFPTSRFLSQLNSPLRFTLPRDCLAIFFPIPRSQSFHTCTRIATLDDALALACSPDVFSRPVVSVSRRIFVIASYVLYLHRC